MLPESARRTRTWSRGTPPGLALGLGDEEPGKAPATLRWIHREAAAIEPAIAFVPEQQRCDCGSAQQAGPSARRDPGRDAVSGLAQRRGRRLGRERLGRECGADQRRGGFCVAHLEGAEHQAG